MFTKDAMLGFFMALPITLLMSLTLFTTATACPSLEKFELPADYSLTDAPTRPQPVWLRFAITEVTLVSDLTNTLHMQGSLTLKWNESRLTLKNEWKKAKVVHLSSECVDSIWTPDVWIDRLVEFGTHNVMGNLDRLLIRPPHELEYWQSVTLTILCPMNLDEYPLDEQQCVIQFSSNGLRVTEQQFDGAVELLPRALNSPAASEYELGIEQNPNFTYNTPSCSSPNEECWPQIAATLHLRRYFRTHGLQAFLPSACSVVLSWISFLIPPYIVPGRMVLLVTLLLVVLEIYATQYQATPNSRMMNVQDAWFLSCVLFILCAIFEYAFCLYIKRTIAMRRWREQKRSKIDQAEKDPVFVINLRKAGLQRARAKDAASSSATRNRAWSTVGNGKSGSGDLYGDINDSNMEGERFLADVDFCALRLFPIAFIIFLAVFWTLVLT